jgi:predicted amidohydrolase YtcJ
VDAQWFTNLKVVSAPAAAPPVSLLVRAGRVCRVLAGPLPPGEARAAATDLGGAAVLPGPVDAHCHLVSWGMLRRREVELRDVADPEELVERLRARARALGLQRGDGRWLLGRGFDQERFPGRRWPDRQLLDAAAPGIPVRLTRVCGHAVVASTAALQVAGMEGFREPGFPEGVVTEGRIARLAAAIPEPGPEEWREAAREACLEAARVGFVGVHSLMADEREVRALVALRREGPLPVRVTMQLPYALLPHLERCGLASGFGDDTLRLGAVKLFSDGSLGARTAALEAPYSDDPSTCGELIYPPEALARAVGEVYAAGFQVCIHAIGDRALRVTLEAMEAAARHAAPPAPPRVEHASLVTPPLLRRMRALGAGAAIQPQFARSDFWAPARLGPERARGCYAFRTTARAGVPLAGSTDCPVEPLEAMAALGQLVSRPEWSPHEGLELAEAVRVFAEGAYTVNGERNGRLEPGDRADFTVLGADPRGVPPEAIERIPVRRTVVGGRVVWQADDDGG